MSGSVRAAVKVRAASSDKASTGASSERFTLHLFHGFELRHGDDVVPLPISAQRLVAFLALRSRPVHRLHVAGTLWIDTSEKHANACLRTALWRLRRFGASVVVATSTHVAFSDSVAVDAHETATRATESVPSPTLVSLRTRLPTDSACCSSGSKTLPSGHKP